MEREIQLLHLKRVPRKKIAEQIGCSEGAVWNHLRHPSDRTVKHFLTKRYGVDPKELRDTQKRVLMTRFEAMTEKACDLAERQIDQDRPGGFNQTMQGIRLVDQVSGNTVGENQPVNGSGSPVTITVDLKLLIAKILGRVPDP